jgi:serine/threonine protein kinase
VSDGVESLLGGRYRLIAPNQLEGHDALGSDWAWSGYDELLSRFVVVRGFSTLDFGIGIYKDLLIDWIMNKTRALALLDHPGIASIYDIGEHEGSLVIVTEYLVGSILGKKFDDHARWGASDPSGHGFHSVRSRSRWERNSYHDLYLDYQVAKLVTGILESLHYAHSFRLAHGDLKPSNVLLTYRGPVLLNFGLTEVLSEVRAHASSTSGTGRRQSEEEQKDRPATPDRDLRASGAYSIQR